MRFFAGCALQVVYFLCRILLALRYRIRLSGMETLTEERLQRKGGILFLPNHPAQIDPVILEMLLGPKFRPRPLVVDRFFDSGFVRSLLRLVKALPLPTMGVMASYWRGKKVERLFRAILEGLRRKENFLVYPAGHLKLTGRESIGGASFVHDLLQADPEINVVLVRTTGLWGSAFSRGLTKSVRPLGELFALGFKVLVRNLFFFAPRRDVLVELAIAPSDFPYLGSRIELNQYLERWYNQGGEEKLSLVSYAFWKEKYPEVVPEARGERGSVQVAKIPPAIERTCVTQIAKLAGRSPEEIKREMAFSVDLGLDSLDMAQLYVFLEEVYDVAEFLPGDLVTVEDFLQAAAGVKQPPEGRESVKESVKQWPSEGMRLSPALPEGESLQEAFLRQCDRMGGSIACVDALSSALSYRRLKRAALILSFRMRELPGERIGVLLPSSVGAYLSILAILLAGKTPVMLNWTVGTKALDHAVEMSGLQSVVSSDRFLDRLDNGDLGKAEERFCLLEDVRTALPWRWKLYGLYLSLYKAPKLLQKLKLAAIKGSDPAVILFTSGTESLPKGVPLSHGNLLSNHRAALPCLDLKSGDILYGILPPFHSFGFSVTGLLPLLAGLKVCYAPDPNHSRGLAHDIASWRPTLFCCAPSFIRALFQVAEPKALSSLRYIVCGAEKTPQELFAYVDQYLPGTMLLEGYGITECAPMVCMDRPGEPHKGVGKPFPGVRLCVVDSETKKVLAEGEEGEICISGPNVFSGYLGTAQNPFLLLDHRRWYLSGDRGVINSDGILTLTGRLKRFVKIGGEMVGLSGLEEEILRIAQVKGWVRGEEKGVPLAVSAKGEGKEKSLIVLYTTFSVTKEEVNAALKEGGVGGRIVKVGEIRQVREIPLTGTGKTHYRLLDELY